MTEPSPEITQYLHDWKNGDLTAFEGVMPLIYDELRSIARHYRARERDGHTLQTTEIINEAYLRLRDQSKTDWQGRSHFFAVASRVMRNLLVDHARAKLFQKRGAGAEKVDLDGLAIISPEPDASIINLHEALERLEALDERKARIVELRYFGGLSAQETGDVIGVSEITVKREWLKAKAWLYNELSV